MFHNYFNLMLEDTVYNVNNAIIGHAIKNLFLKTKQIALLIFVLLPVYQSIFSFRLIRFGSHEAFPIVKCGNTPETTNLIF